MNALATKAKPSAAPTTADFERRRQAVQADLGKAKTHYQECCYAYMSDNENAKLQSDVIAAKKAVDLLEAELVGIGAAKIYANRQDELARLGTKVEDLESQRARVHQALDATMPAMRAMVAKLDEFASAYHAYREAETEARRQETIIAAGVQGNGNAPQPRVGGHSSDGILEGLLWDKFGELAVSRSEWVIDVSGTRNTDRPLETVAAAIDQAHHEADQRLDIRLAALRSEIERKRTEIA